MRPYAQSHVIIFPKKNIMRDGQLSVHRCHSLEKPRQLLYRQSRPISCLESPEDFYGTVPPPSVQATSWSVPSGAYTSPGTVTPLHTTTTKIGSLWPTKVNSYLVKNLVRSYLWGDARVAGGAAPTYHATMW